MKKASSAAAVSNYDETQLLDLDRALGNRAFWSGSGTRAVRMWGISGNYVPDAFAELNQRK